MLVQLWSTARGGNGSIALSQHVHPVPTVGLSHPFLSLGTFPWLLVHTGLHEAVLDPA